jgi:glutamate 5-kinase
MRNFSSVKRIVIKIGTSTIGTEKGINSKFIRHLAFQIQKLLRENRQVVIVTSGAIGMGAGRLGIEERVSGIKKRQACAAIGQPLLMQDYYRSGLAYRRRPKQPKNLSKPKGGFGGAFRVESGSYLE